MIPVNAHSTDTIAEQIVTALKLRNILIADKAGKMTSADISSEPTRFIASTMMTAITVASRKLYRSAFVPTAFEKSSSNVTANILL